MSSLIGICLLNTMLQTYGQPDSVILPTNLFAINATISLDHNDTSHPNWIYYDVKDFNFTISNHTDLCPTDACTYSFVNENREGFRLDDSNGRRLNGLLNVISDSKSKTFHVYGYFNGGDITAFQDKGAKEALRGTLQFYLDDVALGKEYQVNGSLARKSDQDAELALKGLL